MEKVFLLVLGQCSRAIRDRLEAAENWDAINNDSDTLELLRLVRQCMYNRATTRKSTHTLWEATNALHKFRQGERMSNSD